MKHLVLPCLFILKKDIKNGIVSNGHFINHEIYQNELLIDKDDVLAYTVDTTQTNFFKQSVSQYVKDICVKYYDMSYYHAILFEVCNFDGKYFRNKNIKFDPSTQSFNDGYVNQLWNVWQNCTRVL